MLTTEEQALVDAMQADLASVKRSLGEIAANARKLAKINSAAGRGEASAKALKFQGAMTRVRGSVIEAHADASLALAEAYGPAGEVIAFGWGGGR